MRQARTSMLRYAMPLAGLLGGPIKVILISLAISVSAWTDLQAWDIHQSRAGAPAVGGRMLVPRGRTGVSGFYYNGYRLGGFQPYRGPLVIAPRWRQNQGGAAEDPANHVADGAQAAGPQSNGANLSAASQSLSSAQGTARKPINLPPGIKPQVTTPAERSQAVANIKQKFQQAENKVSNQPWTQPNRRNRLEQSCVCFIALIDWGYPLSLLDTWCNDLLDDQVDVGMPVDLVDAYWGQPVSTQEYEEYYTPYEVYTYQTPDGNYRQVTFQNGVVTQPM
jgi:hypothetical protein